MATGGLAFRGPFLLLFAVGQQVSELMGRTFAAAPLRPTDFAVYSALRLTGPVTPAALATELGMGRSTLSNWLRRMEERGHLRRRRNPADGRSALVSLTAEGVRVTEACFPAFQAAIEAFRARLDDEAGLLAALEAAGSALAGAIEEVGVLGAADEA